MKMSCCKASMMAAAALLAIAGTSFGQDSVPTSAGGNDALPAYDLPVQQRRYVVDLQTIATSWGNSSAWQRINQFVYFFFDVVEVRRDSQPAQTRRGDDVLIPKGAVEGARRVALVHARYDS